MRRWRLAWWFKQMEARMTMLALVPPAPVVHAINWPFQLVELVAHNLISWVCRGTTSSLCPPFIVKKTHWDGSVDASDSGATHIRRGLTLIPHNWCCVVVVWCKLVKTDCIGQYFSRYLDISGLPTPRCTSFWNGSQERIYRHIGLTIDISLRYDGKYRSNTPDLFQWNYKSTM